MTALSPHAAGRENGTGSTPAVRCRNGHELTAGNVYVTPSTGHRECWTCKRARQRSYQPVTLCPTCNDPLGPGNAPFHSGCEPFTCLCETPRPDGLGECGRCRRLVVSHSWHDGQPGADLREGE